MNLITKKDGADAMTTESDTNKQEQSNAQGRALAEAMSTDSLHRNSGKPMSDADEDRKALEQAYEKLRVRTGLNFNGLTSRSIATAMWDAALAYRDHQIAERNAKREKQVMLAYAPAPLERKEKP